MRYCILVSEPFTFLLLSTFVVKLKKTKTVLYTGDGSHKAMVDHRAICAEINNHVS